MPNMKSVIENRNANLLSKHITLLQHAHAAAVKNQNAD